MDCLPILVIRNLEMAHELRKRWTISVALLNK